MVFFCCNACGESLKKNQVEKHYTTKCRQCDMLSCVDCGKEFWGDSYKEHVKCISEDQKYGGKNYIPKPGANKGEIKQELWIQQVQQAIQNCKGNKKLQDILSTLMSYSNIPRKKAKFENFVRNSLKIHDRSLVSEVWNVMEAASQKMAAEKETSTNALNGDAKEPSDDSDGKKENCSETMKNKRERKEERQRKSKKLEKKDKANTVVVATSKEDESVQPEALNADCFGKSKKKKRKRAESEDGGTNGLGCSNGTDAKKKKLADDKDVTICRLNETLDNDCTEKKTSKKFDWEQVVCAILRSAGGEMALKKVRKKVLSHYLATCQGQGKTEEKIWAKYEKKINKSPMFKVHKERVSFSK